MLLGEVFQVALERFDLVIWFEGLPPPRQVSRALVTATTIDQEHGPPLRV
jgi:hypothetical protein